MKVSDFDYALPAELIAQHPAPERTGSRLLHLEGASGALEDLAFAELPRLVDPRDLVVVNDTRVIRARLFGRKASGGRVELFIERVLGPHEALALVRAGHPPCAGSALRIGDEGGEGVAVEVLGRQDELYRVRFPGARVAEVLERWGRVPLPPYIRHAPEPRDEERYQTVFAEKPGAVAAPTAGLHFDRAMLRALAARGVRLAEITLHVGSGTFRPVRVDRIERHRMHRERYEVPQATVEAVEAAHARGGRVLAVGTTVLRALESAVRNGAPCASSGETELFVYPGFRFRVVDRLLTNFHLPRSSLLMLACAFGGREGVLAAYRHAIAKRYRFFSYGDAMLIERAA
jgi:S-adenosylmethionine:tRNA ribosyltransferase-isomerase